MQVFKGPTCTCRCLKVRRVQYMQVFKGPTCISLHAGIYRSEVNMQVFKGPTCRPTCRCL